MKETRVFKSLAKLSSEVVEPEPARPAPARETPKATSGQLREALLLIHAEDNSAPAGYLHWGLNE